MGQNQVTNFLEADVLEGTDFDEKVREYRKWHEQETEAKKKKKELGPEIESLLLIAEHKSLGVDDLIAVQCNGSTASYIDGTLLVQMGVDADIVRQCTIPGKQYSYIQVRRLGEKE